MSCGFTDNSSTTGASQAFNMISGSYFSPLTGSGNAAGAAVAANLIYLQPFRIILRAAAMCVDITAGIAASSVRLGLYSCDSDGKPADLIEQSGNISTAAIGLASYGFTGGVETIQHPVWIASLYSAAVSARVTTTSSVIITNNVGCPTPVAAANTAFTTPLAFGALPASLSGSVFAYQLSSPIAYLVSA